jgi:hypothetical protein
MTPILEIKPNRFTHLIVFSFALGLSGLFFWLLYIKDPGVFEDDWTGKLIITLLIPVGIFICFKSISLFIRHKPTFGVYEDGFINNTHGISSELMKWTDIKRVEEKMLNKEDGSSDRALLVYFNNPDHYTNSQTGGSKVLLKLASAPPISRQLDGSFTDRDGLPMMIMIGALGKHYNQIKFLMEEKIKAGS